MKVTAKQVKQAISVDTVSKRNGVFTVRREFFFSFGQTSQTFANQIEANMREAGFSIEIVAHGEVWKPFRGGAATKDSSHWWVEFKVGG